MRITIVSGAFLPMPPASTGAIEKTWQRLAEAFAASGNRVTIICAGCHGEAADGVVRGVRYIRLRRRRRTGAIWSDLAKDAAYSCSAQRRLPVADVTITNSFWLPALLRLGGRRRNGVLNVHAQRFPKHQYRLYRGADRISTVSEAIAAAICEQVPDLAHIVRVIPNPVDVSVFRPTCRCLEGSRGNGATRTILFTGRIHPEKGLELLVRAFTLMHRADQRVRLVLVGPTELEYGGGGASFVRALKALAAGAPIEMRASIANPVELASTLRSCDVYCYPSIAVHGEASPVAPLEAMACGAVPVVSDLPQFAGYIRDGETGLVFAREAPDAVERLAACLRGVMDAPERASALRAAGVARAKELSVERVAEAHLVDFKRLVDARCGDYSGR